MAEKVRIYQLAKELDIDSKEMLSILDSIGVEYKSHASTLDAETAESVELASRVTIEVHTASFRTVRGYTVVAALCDEIAYWRSEESTNPDAEIVAVEVAECANPGCTRERSNFSDECFQCRYEPDERQAICWLFMVPATFITICGTVWPMV